MVVGSRTFATITGKLSALSLSFSPALSPQFANRALTVHDRTISSAAGKLDRSTVELVTVSVGNAHGTSCRTQLGTNDAKLAREAVSFIDRVICVFEDHAALVFEVRADDEIKIEVWHWSPLPSSNCTESNLSLVGSLITTLILTSDCGRLLRFGTATASSRAHQRDTCASLGCSSLSVKVVLNSKKRAASSSDQRSVELR